MEAVFLRSIEFKNEPASIQPYKYNTYSNITNDVNSRFTQSLGLAAGEEKESSHVFELGKTGELNPLCSNWGFGSTLAKMICRVVPHHFLETFYDKY